MSAVTDLFSGKDRSKSQVDAGTAFRVNQVQQTLDLLKQLAGVSVGEAGVAPTIDQLSQTGTELTQVAPEDRARQNFDLAQALLQPQLESQENALARSFASRGISGGGISAAALGETRADVLSQALNEALSKSFDEAMKSKELGSGILQALLQPQVDLAAILSQFVGGLGAAGTRGQAQSFGASEGARASIFGSSVDALARGAGGGGGGGINFNLYGG